MKKNIKKVKRYQKPLMCLVVMFVLLLGIAIGKFINAKADEINYEYVSDSIGYNNENSSLNATNVKDAIDELYGKVGQCPTGQFCYSSEEIRDISGGNFLRAYVYDENSCVTGNESGCIKTNCYKSGTCPVGTIIDYFVNNATLVRFHVLHDDGDTMTMQAQKNTVYNVAWHAGEDVTSKGPDTIMSALKNATDGWINVNPVNITSSTTSFTGVDSINNLCTYDSTGVVTCSSNQYDIGNIAGTYRARMITMQEATDRDIGQCKAWVSDGLNNNKSCRMFMSNFLHESTSPWGCKNELLCVDDDHHENGANHNSGYWTMGADLSADAWRVIAGGLVVSIDTSDIARGARAVVVVNK